MQVNPGTGNAVKSVLQGESGQRLESALIGFKRGDAYGEGFPKLDGKYGAAQRLNSQWGGGVLLSQWVEPVERLAKEAKKEFDKGMKEHKDKLDKIDKQNKETNRNVEHINRELDRISREMKEKASQKDSGK